MWFPPFRVNDSAEDRVDKVNGKTLYRQEIEVSSDGKTLTMKVHTPGWEKPDLMVFDRE